MCFSYLQLPWPLLCDNQIYILVEKWILKIWKNYNFIFFFSWSSGTSYASTTVGTGHRKMINALFIIFEAGTINGRPRTSKQILLFEMINVVIDVLIRCFLGCYPVWLCGQSFTLLLPPLSCLTFPLFSDSGTLNIIHTDRFWPPHFISLVYWNKTLIINWK